MAEAQHKADTLDALEREARRYLRGELSAAIFESALRHFGSPVLADAHKRTWAKAMRVEADRHPTLRMRLLQKIGMA